MIVLFASPASMPAALIQTCPLCTCPPPPGCICDPFYCPPNFRRFGFDTGGNIEPGDNILGIRVDVQLLPGANASIFLNNEPPIIEAILPPNQQPGSFDEDVRTFISSYSCYPNNMEPEGFCPVNVHGDPIIGSNALHLEWSPNEEFPGPGSYTLFRLALDQPQGNGPLTLEPTDETVAIVSGFVEFSDGAESIEYTVYRLPACACPGDTNGDGQRNGADIASFTDCVIEGGLACICADMDQSGLVEPPDVQLFVSQLLSGASCNPEGIMRITEWMYEGANNNEFVEFTNVGDAPVDMTGWWFNKPLTVPPVLISLSGFGTIGPGQSAVLTSAPTSNFITAWSLSGSAKVLGGTSLALARNDQFRLLNGNVVVDQLSYGDNQNFPGSIQTLNISGNPATPAALGANDVYQWVLSSVGDSRGSYAASNGNVGNPCVYNP